MHFAATLMAPDQIITMITSSLFCPSGTGYQHKRSLIIILQLLAIHTVSLPCHIKTQNSHP